MLSDDERAGRDPGPADLDREILYLSGDLPLATPQEISAFVQAAQARVECGRGGLRARAVSRGCARGLPAEGARRARDRGRLLQYSRRSASARTISIMRARPASAASIASRRCTSTAISAVSGTCSSWPPASPRAFGGLKIAILFGVMHLAGIADRGGMRRLARWLGRLVTLEINRKTIAKLLDTKFVFIVTESGGCALDIDTEEEYDAMCAPLRRMAGPAAGEIRAPLRRASGAVRNRGIRCTRARYEKGRFGIVTERVRTERPPAARAETTRVREGVGLFAMDDRGLLVVRGSDRCAGSTACSPLT